MTLPAGGGLRRRSGGPRPGLDQVRKVTPMCPISGTSTETTNRRPRSSFALQGAGESDAPPEFGFN